VLINLQPDPTPSNLASLSFRIYRIQFTLIGSAGTLTFSWPRPVSNQPCRCADGDTPPLFTHSTAKLPSYYLNLLHYTSPPFASTTAAPYLLTPPPAVFHRISAWLCKLHPILTLQVHARFP
jgi:hypothetical protein